MKTTNGRGLEDDTHLTAFLWLLGQTRTYRKHSQRQQLGLEYPTVSVL